MVCSTQQGPPSARDFDVYRRVKIERASTRQAAKEAQVSQTRVCQIVQRVADYMTDVVPTERDEEKREQRLNIAEQLAAEQLDFLALEAMQAWRASKGEFTTVREVALPGLLPSRVEVTRVSQGDQRYLMAASRLAKLGAKLPISLLKFGVEEVAEESAKETSHPLEVACSASASEQGDQAEIERNEEVVSVSGLSICEESPPAEQALPIEMQRTVQGAKVGGGLGEVLGVERGELQLPPAKSRPLTKQERKRKAKLAQMKLKEARKRLAV